MTDTTTAVDTIPVELFRQHMAELYWLAFLITDDRDQSVDAFTDALVFDEPAPVSRRSMLSWARKLVIVAALDAVHSRIQDSKQRTRTATNHSVPPYSPVAVRQLSTSELEEALPRIDVFPRCALLLTVFEGLSVNEASILLDADWELVKAAQVHGVVELTRNLTTFVR